MYLKHASIRNYRAIESIELQFKPGINILLGDNGVGKTSILEAIAVSLGGFLGGITGVSAKGIQQPDIRLSAKPMAGASVQKHYYMPVELDCTTEINGTSSQWMRYREDESGKGKTKTKMISNSIVKYARNLANDEKSTLPLLAYLSIYRIASSKRSDFGSALAKKLDDRRCGYIGCLDDVLDINAITAWMLKMEMSAFQKDQVIPEYEVFKSIVSSVMRKMSELDFDPLVRWSRQFEDIVYVENDNELPISYLSAGYQSLLWTTMNIAYRMALLNPQCDYARETSGIVLIDELDMHLHPKWQWNVLKTLEETFPKIQFIIATHSPILISSCKNANLISIDNEHHVCSLESAYGYAIDDIVELVQGSSSAPRRIKDLLHQFETAINKGDLESAGKVYGAMKLEFGKDNSQVKYAEEELRFENFDFSEE